MLTKKKQIAGIALAAAVAITFAAAPVTSALAASKHSKVPCYGVNACKGKSACKTAASSCKGQNACKGKGVMMMSKGKCKRKGGSLDAPQQ